MTPEQAIAWIEKVEELEGNAFAGREVTDEETVRIGNYYLSGDYLIKNLEIIRQEKQKTLDTLAHLEAAEKRILDKIAQKQIVL
ncbi:hypothetical protein AB0758_45260 [Tolypothrix bouteillei VB521301_2]|uniref:Uncharacterized protein n=1 Tax=Tolypothrix bouteillei VB521301 TaxID=1479485 RepID=A0A0C1RPI7_9CYAN